MHTCVLEEFIGFLQTAVVYIEKYFDFSGGVQIPKRVNEALHGC